MNRTIAFFVTAAALGLVALVVKLPGPSVAPAPQVVTPKVDPVKPPDPPKPDPKGTPGSLSLAAKLSHPYLTPGSSDVFLTADVTAVEVPGSKRAPVNMALVIDRSGSMAGEKIVHARQAALALLDQLDEHDRLTVVHFGSDVSVLPGAFVTEDNRRRMRAFINHIIDDGGTNIGGGLAAGKAQLDKGKSDFKVNRLVLVSDGQPTVGITSGVALTRLAQGYHADGVTLTAIGVGLDFNEDLMTRLASVGGGSYGYLRNTAQLAGLFSKDLQQAGTLVARDVQLKLKLPATVSFGEALGRDASVGHFNDGDQVTLTLPDFSAGQVEKVVLRVRANAPTAGTLDVADLKLAYDDVLAAHPADAEVKLAALVTLDSALAMSRRDKDVTVAAVRAQTAVNYRKAAEAIAQNKPADARHALQQNEILFDDLQVQGAGEAVKADRAQNQAYFGLTAPSAPRASQLDGVKAMKVQSLKSSGYGDSVY